MRLPQKTFRIANYLDAEEAFHFTRKDLPDTPPAIEHCHDYYELMLVEHGQVHHWINGVEELLEPGHLVFVRPADSHALQSAAGTGARILNVMFRPATAEHLVERYGDDLSGRFFWQRGLLPVTLRLRGPQKERAVNAMLTLQTSHRSLTRIELFLLSVMTHVLDAAEVVDDRAPPWLLAACRAAREPRIFRQGAEGFLTAAGRSHQHVCRQTRRYLGLSPTQYVTSPGLSRLARATGRSRRRRTLTGTVVDLREVFTAWADMDRPQRCAGTRWLGRRLSMGLRTAGGELGRKSPQGIARSRFPTLAR